MPAILMASLAWRVVGPHEVHHFTQCVASRCRRITGVTWQPRLRRAQFPCLRLQNGNPSTDANSCVPACQQIAGNMRCALSSAAVPKAAPARRRHRCCTAVAGHCCRPCRRALECRRATALGAAHRRAGSGCRRVSKRVGADPDALCTVMPSCWPLQLKPPARVQTVSA